jgi:galactonate dehydratase
MQIISIEPVLVHVNHRGDWLFCLVHTDAGITGLGEASHNTNDALASHLIEILSAKLAGWDPFRIEAIVGAISSKHAGRVANTVASAIEQALWDIMGKALGVPIRTLMGGAVHDRLRLYANINRHVVDRSPAGFAEAARHAVDEGFTAIKLAPFDEVRGRHHVRRGPGAAWTSGVDRVRVVREAIGPDVELAVDCHGRFDEGEAILVAKELQDLDLFWLEEAVPHTLPEALERITAAVSMPTASAESVFGMVGFRPFLTRHLVDVIMPDVKHDGGLLETKLICGGARMAGISVAPHSPAGPVSTAATAQVMSTEPTFYILEYAWGEAEWRADLLDPPERIEEGYLLLPEGPGLGHRLSPDVLDAHRLDQPSSTDSSMALPVT